ncbi:MAG: hypothetical protein K0U59_05460 [Gammaproteobacteria bacterium]|nr:hypothetical protein [Gammaproteobacteria bacterium]
MATTTFFDSAIGNINIHLFLAGCWLLVAHLLRKRQLNQEGVPAYRQFMALAG